MYTLRQNRWMALLIGVLLVCFSAICFFVQNDQARQLQVNNTIDAAVLRQVPEQSDVIVVKGWMENNPMKSNKMMDFQLPDAKTFISGKNNESTKTVTKANATASTKAKVHTAQEVAKPQVNPPITLFFSRTHLLSPSEKSQATRQYTVSADEVHLLNKIVMAEAEGEPYKGKVAVANVVLNRLRSANFPNTIKDVIYQKYQFSPVANGRLKRVHPNEDSIRAVKEALSGRKEVSDDTYYFLSLKLADDLTVKNTRTYAKTIGNHSFYK